MNRSICEARKNRAAPRNGLEMALAGEEMPLTRDTAGARHPGISRGGVLYRRAKLVCAARRKCANTPCAAARSPLALRPLPPKGRRSF